MSQTIVSSRVHKRHPNVREEDVVHAFRSIERKEIAMLTEREAMKICGLTDGQLDEKAKPYEDGSYELGDSEVHVGPHIDRVGKKRVTVVFDAGDAQQVNTIARNRGVKPSVVYRDAVKFFLSRAGA